MRFRRFLTPRAVAVGVGVIVLFVVFAGTFRAPGSGLLPPPSSTSPTTAVATTTSIDYSGVALPTVGGQRLPRPLVETGRSVIRGSVEAPGGRVPGATVRLERLVGDQVQRLDAVTSEDGTFRLESIPGGRYRVRAWLAPTITMNEPEVFFLTDGDERELTLRTEELDQLVVRSSTRPDAPIVGDGVNVAIRVADLTVDADGVAREQPRAGVPVSVLVSGWAEVEPGVVRVTDADGTAVFEFSCERAGSVSATAYIGGAAAGPDPSEQDPPPGQDDDRAAQEIFPLEVPACTPAPSATTSTPDDGPGGDDTTSTTDG